MSTTTPSKTFTAQAITNEISRRAKNKVRKANGQKKARASSWVFSPMSSDDLKAVLDGQVVEVNYKSGRTEHVGLAV